MPRAREQWEQKAQGAQEAERAKAHLELLDKVEKGEADIPTLREVIGLLEASGDYGAAAPLKIKLGRLAAAQEAREGRRG